MYPDETQPATPVAIDLDRLMKIVDAAGSRLTEFERIQAAKRYLNKRTA